MRSPSIASVLCWIRAVAPTRSDPKTWLRDAGRLSCAPKTPLRGASARADTRGSRGFSEFWGFQATGHESRRGGARCISVALALLATACAPSADRIALQTGRVENRTDPIAATELRNRAKTEFEWAMLVKPRDVANAAYDLAQAPLFAVQLAEEDGPSALDARPRHLADVGGQWLFAKLTDVFVDRRSVSIAGRPYDQVLYAWECAAYPERSIRRVSWRICGVRATIGGDGRALVWELLTDPQQDELYVSSAFEDAAKARYGGPLPGREFSIERSVDSAPRTIVADVLEDGPIPMGPYVYLADQGRTVTTLLCRCSPSRMNEVAQVAEYELRDVEELGETWAQGLVASPQRPLDERIRWPGP